MSEPDAPTPSEIEADDTQPEPEPAAAEHAERGQEIPIPPATFDFFVLSMKMQTEVALGLLHFGEEKDRPKADFRVARHSIDLLAMIAEKTRGNLTLEEQRLIDNSLTELRFRYVQTMESQSRQKS